MVVAEAAIVEEDFVVEAAEEIEEDAVVLVAVVAVEVRFHTCTEKPTPTNARSTFSLPISPGVEMCLTSYPLLIR